MERADVLKQVAAELGHIPRWPGPYQGLLRSIYQMLRANSLGLKKAGSAGAILHRSIAVIVRDYPTAEAVGAHRLAGALGGLLAAGYVCRNGTQGGEWVLTE